MDNNRGDPNKTWVKAIAKKLRDDLGDCPTLPDDMLRLLDKLREKRPPNARNRFKPGEQVEDECAAVIEATGGLDTFTTKQVQFIAPIRI